MKRLLTNCAILETVNGDFHYIEKGFLGIAGDVIDYIGETHPGKRYDEEKDMQGKMIIPGLINAHTHSAMTLLRGVGSDLALQDWLFGEVIPIENRLQEADLRAGMGLALLEMLSTGTTSYTDMYMGADIEADLIKASGIKATLCKILYGSDPEQSYEENGCGKEAIRLFQRYNGTENGRLLFEFCVHAEYTSLAHLVRAYALEAKNVGARMHIHMSETQFEHEECIRKYGKTPAGWFNDLGAFDVPCHAAHCVWVSDSDMEIMKEKGVSCVHNPTSNMKLGSGFAPVVKMLDRGINVAIGTDGAASNNNLNMFEEMHMASVIHKGYSGDPTALGASDILKMATINGAKLQGRNDTGAIEVGKKADLVAIDLSGPHMRPVLDPVALIVYAAQGSDVAMTMVDGRILYEDGKFLTLDQKRIYRDVEAAVDRLYGNGNVSDKAGDSVE